MINFREGWRGYLSSARAHLTGLRDGLTETGALGVAAGAWRDFLAAGLDDAMLEAIRSGERTGRPLVDAAFVARLEAATGRRLARRKPGPKPTAGVNPYDQRRLI